MNLFLDIETRSTVDPRKSGVYVYAESPATEILMVAYALDNDPVTVWLPRVEPDMPLDLAAAIADQSVRLVAHNASFERSLLSYPPGRRIGFPNLSALDRWDCTAARAAHLGLPRTLEGAGAAIGLGTQKDKEGHALMLRMCKPRKPRKDERKAAEEYAKRGPGLPGWTPPPAVLWLEDDVSMARLAAYCVRDVEVEREIHRVLPDLSATERRVWMLTERMNDTGVPVDVRLLGAMLQIIEDTEIRLDAEISRASGGVVPRVTDHMALTRWLISQGIDDAAEDGVGKAAVAAMLENTDLDPAVRNVLALRRDGGGTSSKKYRAILARLSADGRIRGVLVYCGAAATGRWSSRGAQLQNLSRGGKIKDDNDKAIDALHMVRDVLAGATADEIETIYGPALVVAAECLRPLFAVPADAEAWLARCDYSQIEARVNPWLAGAEWKLDAFRDYDAGTGPDLYRVMAAKVFGVPVDQVTSAQRQGGGKVPELALGFEGGGGALQNMAKAYGMKLPHVARPKDAGYDWEPPAGTDEWIKVTWRRANPEIKGLWRGLNYAAVACMQAKPGEVIDVFTRDNRDHPMHLTSLSFMRTAAALSMRLPSGRRLIYWTAKLRDVPTPWGSKLSVIYRAEDSVTKRWSEFVGYGGLFCENAVQATARDIMADALLKLDDASLCPLLTVHDEAVCMLPRGNFPTADDAARAVEAVMRQKPAWCGDLPVAADSSAHERYVKG